MFFVPVTRSSADLGRGLERLFDDRVERFLAATPTADTGVRNPALDVTESEQAYTVQLDMPGVTKEAVKIAIDGKRVSVDALPQRLSEQPEGDRLLHRERVVTRYARRFSLPTDIDQTASQARLEQGVLTLTLAKRHVPGASQLTVN